MPFAGRNQFFDAKTTFWVLLSHKMYKINQKITKIMFLKGVYQHLGVTPIWTSEQHAEHPFAGRNTQHLAIQDLVHNKG